jgi:hydroxymethylglutaryl-CoA lyase
MARITVHEVGPRDGLQNEGRKLSAAEKLELIGALADARLPKIEVTSFVRPGFIPQLSDAAEVAAGLPRREGVTFTCLVPNAQGLEGALAGGLTEIAVFLSASESHNKKNVGKTIEETFAAFDSVVGPARAKGLAVRGYVSTAWGCPYEGKVDPRKAVEIAKRLLALGCYQVSLGDTIGVGTPNQTREILDLCLAVAKPEQLALHMHDTHGTALANVLVGLQAGLTCFDASIGGMGGCPHTPGASGNLATEDLVYLLNGMGHETGVSFGRLIEAGELAQKLAGRQLPGRTLQAELGRRDQALWESSPQTA